MPPGVIKEALPPTGDRVRPLEAERREVLQDHHPLSGEGAGDICALGHEPRDRLHRGHHLWIGTHAALLSRHPSAPQVKRNGNML